MFFVITCYLAKTSDVDGEKLVKETGHGPESAIGLQLSGLAQFWQQL